MTPAPEEPGHRSTPTHGRVIPSGVPSWHDRELYVVFVGEVVHHVETLETASDTLVPVIVFSSDATGEAHTQLTAAAPDLYVASVLALAELESVHAHFYPKCHGVCPWHTVLDTVRAAVAKADRPPSASTPLQPPLLPMSVRLRDAWAVLAGRALAVHAIRL